MKEVPPEISPKNFSSLDMENWTCKHKCGITNREGIANSLKKKDFKDLLPLLYIKSRKPNAYYWNEVVRTP